MNGVLDEFGEIIPVLVFVSMAIAVFVTVFLKVTV